MCLEADLMEAIPQLRLRPINLGCVMLAYKLCYNIS